MFYHLKWFSWMRGWEREKVWRFDGILKHRKESRCFFLSNLFWWQRAWEGEIRHLHSYINKRFHAWLIISYSEIARSLARSTKILEPYYAVACCVVWACLSRITRFLVFNFQQSRSSFQAYSFFFQAEKLHHPKTKQTDDDLCEFHLFSFGIAISVVPFCFRLHRCFEQSQLMFN